VFHKNIREETTMSGTPAGKFLELIKTIFKETHILNY
jgi:hypothetical protein